MWIVTQVLVFLRHPQRGSMSSKQASELSKSPDGANRNQGLAEPVVAPASLELHKLLEALVPNRDRDRLYWRVRGGIARAYGDFRDYADVGGRREALKAPGYTQATADHDVALALLAARLRDLDGRRRGLILHGEQKRSTLYDVAALDLRTKVEAGRLTPSYAGTREAQLRVLFRILGGTDDPECRRKDPRSVSVADIRMLVSTMRLMRTSRGGKYAEPTILTHLHALSGVFKRAGSEGYVEPGFNPVMALQEKPRRNRTEARWLEVPDAALFLESARTYVVPRPDWIPFPYALVATWLLTGCRETEIYGLELDDISFERRIIRIRENGWRRLKTQRATRNVPLWPQLETILRAHFRQLEEWRLERGPGGRSRVPDCELVFPTWSMDGKPTMVQDSRRLLDRLATRAGWKAGEIRTKMFRHTYCAARLQTLDQGAPVSAFTVARELGHSSTEMVEEVYSHLGTVRHRSEAVEFRVEQHRRQIADRLKALEGAGREG